MKRKLESLYIPTCTLNSAIILKAKIIAEACKGDTSIEDIEAYIAQSNIDCNKIMINANNTDCVSTQVSLLHFAASSGSKEFFHKLLYKYKVEDQPSSTCRGKALHFAILNQNLPIVQYLTNLYTKTGRTDLLNEPQEDDSNNTPLMLAISTGSLEITKCLLKVGVDIQVGEREDLLTPVHLAIDNKDIKMLALLIEYGANVDTLNGLHQTPLNYAVQLKYADAVYFLIEKGADAHIKDHRNKIPLEHSLEIGLVKISFLLLEYEARSEIYRSVPEFLKIAKDLKDLFDDNTNSTRLKELERVMQAARGNNSTLAYLRKEDNYEICDDITRTNHSIIQMEGLIKEIIHQLNDINFSRYTRDEITDDQLLEDNGTFDKVEDLNVESALGELLQPLSHEVVDKHLIDYCINMGLSTLYES